MQRVFILFVFSLLFSCIGLFAQPHANFPVTSEDLGELQWKHAGVAMFRVYNTGNEDLRIEAVEPDCGCVAVEWTQAPIVAGESGVIYVVYDSKLLGTFSKGVEVRTNAFEEPAYLHVSGKVVMDSRPFTGSLSYRMGDVYLNNNELEFDDVRRGSFPGLSLMVYNAGDEPYRPCLMHLPKYLTAEYSPEVLQPGELGRIIVAIDGEKLPHDGLTQTSVYLSRFSGDVVKSDNEIKVSATLLPELRYSEKDLAIAPKLVLDTLVVDMRKEKGVKKKVRKDIVLRNAGRSPLVVSALQVYEPGVSASLGKRSIAAGSSTHLKVSLPSDFANAKGVARILLITNDPKRSKVVLKLLVDKK